MNMGPGQRGSVAVVLGAGFSRAVYGLCPLTDDLGEAVRSRLGPADRAKLPPGRFADGRFEEWLSYLSESQPHFTPEESADANALALRVTRLISEVLSQVQADALVAGTGEWFWQFLSVLHVLRAGAITLNYDNFVECGVHTLGLQSSGWGGSTLVCEDDILAGLPPCADFSGISAQSAIERTESGDPIRNAERRDGTFKLLKLHGSLSWYWLPDGGGGSTLRRWRLPGIFGQLWDGEEEQRHQELPAHEVFVVPPASLKGQRLREPVTRELWRSAAYALKTAERLVLMGYSVPFADHSIIGMLSEGLRGREVQIEVVDPSADVVAERLVRLGASANQIRQTSGDDCIVEWTTAEVKRLAAEAVKALRNDSKLTDQVVLIFADGQRVDRFRRLEPPNDPSEPLILHVNPENLPLTKPVMYSDLQPLLGSVRECAVEVDGHVLPVIDHWVREEKSGALMTQLHLVPAGR
jgi:hypothetical protein